MKLDDTKNDREIIEFCQKAVKSCEKLIEFFDEAQESCNKVVPSYNQVKKDTIKEEYEKFKKAVKDVNLKTKQGLSKPFIPDGRP